MEPTLRSGNWLLVTTAQPSHLSPGKLYVIERDEQPGVLFIKRLQKSHGRLHWFEGDNPASTDSREWGWVEEHCVRGKVLFRYKRA